MTIRKFIEEVQHDVYDLPGERADDRDLAFATTMLLPLGVLMTVLLGIAVFVMVILA
ncbi:MAG: hypothetical protein AB7K09_15945 [Planctomycetota bacterium]